MIRVLFLSLTCLLIAASPAAADPISGLIAAAKAFAATKIGAIVLNLAVSKGLSLLAQKLRKPPEQPGLQNRFKGRGAAEADGFVLGRAAVVGHWNWHGASGDNNKFYHEVIELCGKPGATLERLIIDGEYSELGDHVTGDNVDGQIIVSKNKDSDSHRAFLKYYDGTQTTAHQKLVSLFATADRAWTTDHVLRGRCYAVMSYYFDRKRFPNGIPELRFEMLGIPLYDPRKDSSIGGAGAHRFDDPATWEQTENLIVMVYNIARGIDAPGEAIWGGGYEAEDLPVANWVAAMNACDVTIDGRPKYRGGLEVKWTDAPNGVIEKLLAGCGGQIVDVGGYLYVQVDAPETAIVSISDDDVLVSKPSERKPFGSLNDTFNGATVTFPDPAILWNANADFTLRNAGWAAEDGGEQLFDFKLEAVPYPEQAKQLTGMLVKDNRRFLGHKLPLPPEYSILRPLNTLAYTSAFNGYSAKLFEVAETVTNLFDFNVTVSVRERDPSDFNPDLGLELPSTPGVTTPIVRLDAGVTGFAFEPLIITVEDGPKRPAFRLSWDEEELEGNIAGIAFELRLAGAAELAKSGSTTDIEAGSLILSGDIIPNALYECRPRALSNVRDTIWDNWLQARAPNVGIGADEFWAEIDQRAQSTFDDANAGIGAALDRTEEGVMRALADEFLETIRVEGVVEQNRQQQQTEIDSVVATLTQDYLTAASTTAAIAQLETNVNASIGHVESDVTTLTTSLASTDQTVASLQTTLTSEINGLEAWAQQTFRTEAQVDSAVSDAVTQVETDVNGLSTTVSQVQSSVDGIEGVYGLRINNNGVISGFGLISTLAQNGGGSRFYIDADEFFVGKSSLLGNYKQAFSVVGSTVYIEDARLKNASVETLMVEGNAITLPSQSNGGTTVGSGFLDSVVSDVVQVPSGVTGNIRIFWSIQHGYGSGARHHGWRLRVNGSIVDFRGTFSGSNPVTQVTNGPSAISDYIQGQFTVFGMSGNVLVDLEWGGEDSGITCQAARITCFLSKR